MFFEFQSAHPVEHDLVNNAVFGATKNHWYIKKALASIIAGFDGKEAANEPAQGLITRLLLPKKRPQSTKNILSKRNLKVYLYAWFYPFHWNEKLDRKNNIKRKTISIHHWAKS